MTSNKSLDTATFDLKLLMLGKWSHQQSQNIERWIKTSDEQKKEQAAELMNNLIQDLLGEACTAEGRRCSKNLGSTLSHLEELLYTTKGGISKKFYRDHLNHMLRVMLLANSIATQTKNLQFTDEEINLLVLASLFHDIAYPLSEVSQVFTGITGALKKCYRSMNFPEVIMSLDMKVVMKLVEDVELPSGVSVSGLGEYFSNNNHGVLSAMEFLQYLRPERVATFKRSLDAIMFHDSEFDIAVEMTKNKILALLILADEMQDWGRPASFEQEPTISEIREFELSNNSVTGKFVWDQKSVLSPLRQLYSKQKSLKRIKLIDLERELTVNLSFELPVYSVFDHAGFLDKMQQLFISWEMKPDILNVYYMNIDAYQKLYYGAVGGSERKLVSDLAQHKLVSTIGNPKLYYSFPRKEILLISSDCGQPKEINFDLGRFGFTSMIFGEQGSFSGQMVSDSLSNPLDFR